MADNEGEVLVAEINIRYALTPDGGDLVLVSAEDQNGDVPPLLTMLGMHKLAEDVIYELAATAGDTEEEDDDAEDDEDAAS